MPPLSPRQTLLQQQVLTELRTAAQQRLTPEELQQISFSPGRPVSGPPRLLARFVPATQPPPRRPGRPR